MPLPLAISTPPPYWAVVFPDTVEFLSVSVPVLAIPPPGPVVMLLDTATPSSVRVPALKIAPPPGKRLEGCFRVGCHEPFVAVSPLMETVVPELGTAKIRWRSVGPPPFTVNRSAPGPVIVTSSVMGSSGPCSMTVPVALI